MSPDELRAHADLIADRYNIQDGEPALWRAMVHVVQAARNLADVIEYAEWVTYGCADPLGRWENPEPAFEVGASVIRIARGETNEREEP